MLWCATVAALTWQAQPRLAPRSPAARTSVPAMQAGNAAVTQAMKLLGSMSLQAANEASESNGQPSELKEFVASVKITHSRVIEPVDGGAVPDYMRLPVDQYAIYDPRLMRRLPTEEGGTDHLAEDSAYE